MGGFVKPGLDEATIGAWALANLEAVVGIDSASDEASASTPTTPGQVRLADALGEFFAENGATVDRDEFGNVVAALPGRGAGAGKPPVALLVHLDTARGTNAVPRLNVLRAWDGRAVPYPANPALRVDVENYPATRAFLGHDLVYGPGDAPFGLDDKLGMTHLMTLARLLAATPEMPHPPLLLVGRPDEEVGRSEALVGLVERLADEGVRRAFTVDGILPFEINTENFNAARVSLWFPARPAAVPEGRVRVRLGGVNTHGATACAERHRAATRFAAEIDAPAVAFASDALRDCDAVVEYAVAPEGREALAAAVEAVVGPHVPRGASYEVGPWTPGPATAEGAAADALRDCDAVVEYAVGPEGREGLAAAVAAVVGPHVPRGASYEVGPWTAGPATADAAAADALAFVRKLLAEGRVLPVLAEDSEGRQGYSHPYRIVPEDGGVRLDVRLRDFDPAALAERKVQLVRLAPFGTRITVEDQYRDMGPRLAAFPELVAWPRQAAAALGIEAPVLPIRGGTGVDPFLDAGIGVANLGTGYFAPESEKELTSLQLMANHALWLCHLVQVIAVE